MPFIKQLLTLVFWTGGLVLASQAAEFIQAGPLYQEFSLTLAKGERREALGPIFYHERREEQVQWSLPPLFSYTHDVGTDSAEVDFLYPLFTYDRFGEEYRCQLFQLLNVAGGQTQKDIAKHRFSIFPIYLQQRSADASQNYTSLLPVYGNLKNRLFKDEIHFVLFPLYAETRKRDVTTENYLYPVFHLRHGDGLAGWQFWPLLGHEHKAVTTRTNGFDEAEMIPGHDKFFALWPIFANNHTAIGSENPVHESSLLPLYTIYRSPLRDSSTYLWPLGLTITDDREKKYREVGLPWPLVLFTRGEGKTVNRFWPFFSRASNGTLESDFYLWPFYKYNRAQAEPLDRERTRIWFFLYSDLKEKNTVTGAALHRTDVWPLFTARRDLEGNERLQILSLIEPMLPGNKSVERNWSPVWSVWRAEKNARTGASSQSLLWNLWRREQTAGAKKISLLFGLFQYQSSGAGGHWRVFYRPVHSREAPCDCPP